ncbi:MAG: MFS transporter [Abditibacteriota bacterium]|nr:MFS transporter [Abditibacteriota bacterium]
MFMIIIIYLCFISMGLPDGVLGAAWPVMHRDFAVPLSAAGIPSMVCSFCTIISALCSDFLTKRFSVAAVITGSLFLTAASLFGLSRAEHFWLFCLMMIPLGFSGGCIDAALNNYVALHYKASVMSWLHASWGIGAFVGPLITAYFLEQGNWRNCYVIPAIVQGIILLTVLPAYKKWKSPKAEGKQTEPIPLREVLRIPGVGYITTAFFAYCAFEGVTFIWTGSFLVNIRNLTPPTAARYMSLFLLGMTTGRIINGFLSYKLSDKALIKLGCIVTFVGVLIVMIPHVPGVITAAGILIAGLGCAPIYPAIIHSTPDNFGEDKSQAVIGVQMAAAYLGITFVPPLFGALSSVTGLGIYPYVLALLITGTFVMSEILNRRIKCRSSR